MQEKIILAGAASVNDYQKILKAFSDIGFNASFIEVPFIKKYIKSKDENLITWTKELNNKDIIIPLSEYWISQCIKNKQYSISNNALKASRSKKFLYNLFSSFNIPSPKIFNTIKEAQDFIIEQNKKVIVKPEGLFSGYAVKVVDKENLCNLKTFFENASNVHNNALKLFEIENTNSLITEMIYGNEFSADVFLYNGRISIVRITKKIVVEIHGTPCTAICQLVPCSDDFFLQISKWCKALFCKNDISFAQFDFIQTEDNILIPLDFACRVGGGMNELFNEYESNVYADAVLGKQYALKDKNGYLSQFNYLPTKSGVISNENYNLQEGKQFIYKHKGDFVPESPSSIASRIAVVVKNASLATSKDADQLLLGDEYIKFWKDAIHNTKTKKSKSM